MEVIIDITGFTTDEVAKMKEIRSAIQNALKKKFDVAKLDETSVNFLLDPSLPPSLQNHAVARVYTKRFLAMTNTEIDGVSDIVYLLMEKHGGHIHNQAYTPRHASMRGRWNPDCIER